MSAVASPRRLVLPAAALLAAAAAVSDRALGQEPWPNARCYALTLGRWRIEGDTTALRIGPPPPLPDLLVLEDARVDPLSWFRPTNAGDTTRHVAHGRSRDPRWSDADFDPSSIFWRRPERDTLIVIFGTDFGGLELGFRAVGDSLVGSIDTYSDASEDPSWHAAATGRRARCPPAPPRLGILRLAAADTVVPSDRLPWVGISLATEGRINCVGQNIRYEAVVTPDTVAVLVVGASEPRRGSCRRGPLSAAFPLRRAPGRPVLLVKHEGETNHFVLTVTDSSLGLTPGRARTVVADERVRPRPRHNLFEIRCGYQRARAACDDFGSWLARQPGLTRVGPASIAASPYSEQVNEDVRSALFRYDTEATMQRVRTCLASVREQIRATAGVHITITTWLGEELTATPDQPGATPMPSPVTTGEGCGVADQPKRPADRG